MWEPVARPGETAAWNEQSAAVADAQATSPSLEIRAEAAYLLAMHGDGRAWEMFHQLIGRRSALLGQLELAILRYPQSIDPATAAGLSTLAEQTAISHPKQRYAAEGVRAALLALDQPIQGAVNS
ncbi:hypothetical protein [Arthrobacter sp. NPDC090010]|uniref:hypothetical protein n=1 Tax=Arthrobacter sp. NPDC090010 TaxID=3363942 RepID=UPI00382D7F2F